METSNKAFGFHLMLDLYHCKCAYLDNVEYCYNFLDNLVQKLNMHKQSPAFVFKTPEEFEGKQGISGWIPIVESGISIHTLTETDFVSIDIYSCRRFNPQGLADFVQEAFEPLEIEQNYVLRGKKYFGSEVTTKEKRGDSMR